MNEAKFRSISTAIADCLTGQPTKEAFAALSWIAAEVEKFAGQPREIFDACLEFARSGKEPDRNAKAAFAMALVRDTLSTAASWFIGTEAAELCLLTASMLEGDDPAKILQPCCPVCDEVICDGGCPLERVRAELEV